MTKAPCTIATSLSHATKSTGISRLEAEILLAHALNKNRSYLYAWSEQLLPIEQEQSFLEYLRRHNQGEPLAYITGIKEFWSLTLKVTPDTLIPRPETELMVERALELTRKIIHPTIADLGTGSGAIAAALASELPNCSIMATDFSAQTLAVAQFNFKKLGLNNIQTGIGSWFRALPAGEAFDLILSNPPYVAEHDPHLLEDGLPWEPAAALTAGKDGLDDIRHLIKSAPDHLDTEGWLLLEHGNDQGQAVRQLFAESGYREITTHMDLEQRERLTEGRRPVDDGAGSTKNNNR
ncbi:MAG: peptide chain release factor N(5)-glutamine methyltransferase [Sedimenticola sp.]|nr:peptide chain release factor N(5)-glutamine methyltransferase [Sedimenticola sp.]